MLFIQEVNLAAAEEEDEEEEDEEESFENAEEANEAQVPACKVWRQGRVVRATGVHVRHPRHT